MGYIVVILIGAVLGGGELISRYRDAPMSALLTLPAGVYVILNVLAAAGALWLIETFEWTFGQTQGPPLQTTRVLVAGFGAMALFRSSFFTVRVGGQDVSVGPNSVLQVLLDATDRGVDRERATARADEVEEALGDLPFSRALRGLPILCLALMQNVSEDEQRGLAEEIKSIEENKIVDLPTKRLILGLKLMDVVGKDVLAEAATTLRAQRDEDGPDASGELAET